MSAVASFMKFCCMYHVCMVKHSASCHACMHACMHHLHLALHDMLNLRRHDRHKRYIKKTFEDDLCMLPLHVVIWCKAVFQGQVC